MFANPLDPTIDGSAADHLVVAFSQGGGKDLLARERK